VFFALLNNGRWGNVFGVLLGLLLVAEETALSLVPFTLPQS
jgi:hypothetical protein